jgi:hypothetical protein
MTPQEPIGTFSQRQRSLDGLSIESESKDCVFFCMIIYNTYLLILFFIAAKYSSFI